MPSKVLDEYLRKASPQELAALKEAGLQANQAGADLTNAASQTRFSQPVTERPDVVQAGQEIDQAGGKQFEAVNEAPQTPGRHGPSRPYAGEPNLFYEPKNGQEMDGQKMTGSDGATVGQADRQAAMNGQTLTPGPEAETPQTGNADQTGKPRNAYQEALAAGEKARPAASQEKQATSQPAREPER